MTTSPKPFLPSDRPNELSKLFTRTVTAVVLNALNKEEGLGPEATARKLWPDDKLLDTVVKAATSPADTVTSGWASQLAGSATAGFVRDLQTESAAARLFASALRLNLNGVLTANIPRLTTLTNPVFVAEGAHIPVGTGTFATTALGPARKMALILTFTDELKSYSATDAEAVLTTALRESAARNLDAAVFSTTAASSLRPAGILNGVTPITATSGGGLAALSGDIKNLVGAIVDNGGGANVWFFANPRQAAALKLLAANGFDYPIVPTTALASGTIVALEVGAVASAFSGLPQIETTEGATIHLEDTTPLAIGTAGTPNTVAAPTRSLWQSALMALKLRLRCSWNLRAPGMVQVINSVTW